MAGGDHRCVGVRAVTIDDGESSAKRVIADLEVVLVNEGEGAQAEVRQIVSGCRPAGLAQFGRIHEDEPDAETTLDVKGIPVDDAGYLAFLTQTIRSRTIRLRGRRRWWWGKLTPVAVAGVTWRGCGCRRNERGSDVDPGYRDYDHHGNENYNPCPPPRNALNLATISHAIKRVITT